MSNRARGLACAVLVALNGALVAPSALAQADQSGLTYVVAAQSLAAALERFADQSGLSFAYRSEDVAGLRSSGVTATTQIDDALRQLLAGTGLAWRFTAARTVVLEKAPQNGGAPLLLDPVTIEGGAARSSESATGPVKGYVATRSATATKTDTPILETPQSISVVGAEELETRNVQTLEDAIKYTPGMQLTYGATGDSRSSWYRVRGFPVTSTFYRDGMKVSGQNWQKIDSYLLERVEILRGPASVLYGQNVPGGLINTVSKTPQAQQAGEASVGYGSYDWKRAEGDITGPLDAEGRWLYRVTAALQDSNGLNGIDDDRSDRKLFAPSLTWKPKDDSAVTLSVVRQEDDTRGWWPRRQYKTAAGATNPSTYYGETDYDTYHQTQTHVSLLAEHAIDDSLKANLALRYGNYDMDYRQTWAGTPQAGGTTMTRSNYVYRQVAEVYTLDARLQKKVSLLNTRHTLLAGFDYLYQDRDNWSGSAVNDTTINLFTPVHGTYNTVFANSWSDGDIRSPGVYVQDQIEWNQWVLQLGGRQDLAGSSAGSTYQDTFTGRVGLAYKTGFGLVPYASYAESFEPQSGVGWDGTAFDPTTGRQYEIGAKYEIPGTSMLATAALFDLVKQNVLTDDPDATHLCSGSRCSVQTGEVTSRGAELGLTLGLAEGLNAIAAYTYNPITVTKSTKSNELGRQQADTPIHTASVWLDYSLKDGPLAGLGFGGGLRFIGKTTSSTGDLTTAPQLIDEAMLRYDAESWRLSMNVKNILDRDIEYSCSRSTYGETCYLNEPFTVTARLSRKF